MSSGGQKNFFTKNSKSRSKNTFTWPFSDIIRLNSRGIKNALFSVLQSLSIGKELTHPLVLVPLIFLCFIVYIYFKTFKISNILIFYSDFRIFLKIKQSGHLRSQRVHRITADFRWVNVWLGLRMIHIWREESSTLCFKF